MIQRLILILALAHAGLVWAQTPAKTIEVDDQNVANALSEVEDQFDPMVPWKFGPQAAAVHRFLQQLSPEERYDVLRTFTFSKTDNTSIQTVDVISNVQQPPTAFARAIGQRPRPNVFAVPRVGEVGGLFSSAWLLVQSAKEAGRIRELLQEIERRQSVRNDYLVLLAVISGARGFDNEAIEDRLATFIDQIGENDGVSGMQAAVVAAVAAQSETRVAWASQIDDAISDLPTVPLAAKRLVRTAILQASLEPAANSLRLNENWIRVGSATPWYTLDNYLTHWSSRHSMLLLRYPLAGDFRVQLEQVGGHDKDTSALGYGGVELSWSDYRRPEVNQRLIDKQGDSVRYWINGHPVLTESATETSPWVTLKAFGLHTNHFRNLEFTGSPSVLDEVNLIGQTHRRGWKTVGDDNDQAMWTVNGGVLRSAVSESPRRQRLLQYLRPLLKQETLKYEFFADDETMVHPALGRIVFLIQPTGVKLHWLTDKDQEWTGLPPDNAIIEPLFRRGPKPLPLRDKQWNQLSLKRTTEHVIVTLNGTVVYQRPIEAGDDTRLGFFHDPSLEKVLVRNAKLTGDWPSEIPLDNLLAPQGEPDAAALDVAADLFPESVRQTNTRWIIASLHGRSPQEQFRILREWVVPANSHAAFRVAGHFAPQCPPTELQKDPDDRGGQVVSPAIELVAVAHELSLLDELAELVQDRGVESDDDRRAKAALLALVHKANGKIDKAKEQLDNLYRLVAKQPKLPPQKLWPELLVATEFGERANAESVVHEILSLINPVGFGDTAAIRTELLRMLQSIRFRSELDDDDSAPLALANWTPAARDKALRRGSGSTPTTWHVSDGTLYAVGGRNMQQLFFNAPLVGDYEFQFEQFSRPRAWIHTVAGGVNHYCGGWEIKTGQIDGELASTKLAERICVEGNWIHQRYVVRDGVCRMFVNGRNVYEHPVSEGFPWLAIRQNSTHSTTFRDLRLSGSPIIPAQIRLDHDGLDGWHSYYRLDSFGQGSHWQYQDGEITGRREKRAAGSGDERMLCYQWPLPEESTINYRFFYQPGETIVHPTLDRTAFIVAPKGVGLHYVTDGFHDSTFHNKVNLKYDEQQQRSAPGKLLIENDWNSMEVSLRGQRVELSLNGELIFSGQINPAYERLFGLFYYADQTTARIKDVVLRGSWPKELPTLEQQSLANQTVAQLDASRAQLSARFDHDFGKDGFPNELFAIKGDNARLTTSDDGIGFAINSPKKWTQGTLTCKLRMSGDFDVTADFSDFKFQDGDAAFANLVVPLTSTSTLEARMSRVSQGTGKKMVNAQIYSVDANGGQAHKNQRMGWEATSGTLRIARRGKRLHMLVKNADAQQFRLIKSYDSVDTPASQLRLMTIAQRAALASVTWRRIEVRAEQISQIGGAVGNRVILVGKGDGRQMRQLTKPIGDLGNHGSPEFSPDGKKIAFDTWKGSASTAHIFTVNVDGTELRDIGIGTMPTFSPDGKQIAFSSDEGMMIMNADGSDRSVLSRSGWGVQMSPTGKEVAFTDYGASGVNIYVLDLESKRKRPLLAGQSASRYSRIYWNFDWSPNGREICFCADNRQTGDRELATVRTDGAEGSKILGSGVGYANISWHPDGDRIIYSAHDKAYGNSSLFVIKTDAPKSPERLLNDVRLQSMGGGDWSPDGERFVVASAVSKRFSSEADEDLIEKLNDSRDMLPGRFQQKFGQNQPLKHVLSVTEGDTSIQNVSNGMTVTTTKNGRKPGEVAPQLQLVGDFDVTSDIDIASLGGESAGEVHLSVPFATDDKLTLTLVKQVDASGASSLQARCLNGGDEILRETMRANDRSCRLRIARRGSIVHMLASDGLSSDEQLIASYDAVDTPTRNWGFRVAVKSPVGEQIQVTLQQLAIRADMLLINDQSQKQWRRVHTVNIDGTNEKQVVGDIAVLAGHGSPKFSPDGKLIAFDTFRSGFARSHINVVNSDGSQRRDLGQGSMPSFFPDGKRLAFTSNDGLMTMNVDGSDRQLITRNGFSVKISPDGKRVVFSDQARFFNLIGPNLYVMDLESKKMSALLVGQQAGVYSEIQWNGAWSPDGEEFAFRGKRKGDDQYHIAVVSTKGSDEGYTILRSGSKYTCDLGWHPDGKRIFTSRRNDETGGHQLVFLPRDTQQPDEVVPGQNLFHENFSSGVSADGKRLVYTSNPLPQYLEAERKTTDSPSAIQR